MSAVLKAKKLNLVSSSDELKKAGDYYIVESLESVATKAKPHPAIILKCPFCSLDMASVAAHKIEYKKNWWDRLCGYEGKINITTMLQCPYSNTHKFTIKRGSILSV